MFWAFLKKQILVFVRNPQTIILQLVMPIVLITILGFALGGIFEGAKSPIEAKVAYVSHGSEEEDMKEFSTLLEKSELSVAAKTAIENNLNEFLPQKLLKDSVFNNDSVKEFLDYQEFEPEELPALKKNKEYAVIVEVPEKFTYHLLLSLFLPSNQKTEKPELQLYQNENKELSSQMATTIMKEFQHQYTLQAVLIQEGVQFDRTSLQTEETDVAKQMIAAVKPVPAIAYYSIGMSMMFVLFVASMSGTFAYVEKESNVFTRIILSGASRWSYLIGTFISAVIVALLQLLILFGFSLVVYGVVWDDFAMFTLITVCIAIAIGGFAVLVTSLNYLFHSQAVSNFFSSIVVTIFSFLGGSFVPMKSISETIAIIGKYTPNGAAMDAYLNVYQGYGLDTVSISLVILCCYGIGLTIIGVLIFPKEVSR